MLKNDFKNKPWFTLIEVMVGIIITSIIIIIWFEAIIAITVWKVKLIESTNIEKETFFFNQKLFEEIKKGWLVDYEEYFNRKVVDNTTYEAGHYAIPTWFGNFWNGWNPMLQPTWPLDYGNNFYYCRSISWASMWVNGCVSNYNSPSPSNNYNWEPQRYGQYSFQFIDYNSNHDADWWDEDNDGKIIWDDDDEYIGDGPSVFTSGSWVTELYLISADKRKRTYFRWKVENDIYFSCDFSNPKMPTWSWCVWTIEFLRLEWKDWGMNHTIWGALNPDADGTQYDWVVDTWIIDPDFSGESDRVAWSNTENYRLPLFPDTINVANFEVLVYPNKDIKEAWKDDSEETNTAPYLRLKLKLSPSRKIKKKIKWKIPEFEISTTISLTDIYSR